MKCQVGNALPQHTPRTASDVLDFDYSELWARVRAAKRISPDQVELRMAKDEDDEGRSEVTTHITDTTSIQPDKTSRRYAEEMLHPRWIAISEDMREDEMEHLETQLGLHCAGDYGAAPLESGLQSIQNTIGDLFAEITSEQSEKIDNSLKYLNAFGALEAQWEQRIWRPFFLKDIQGTPMDHNGRAQGHQIQQAKLSFHGRCVLPPLLARENDRRASRRIVSSKPWDPEFKQSTNTQSGSVSWFPDYLYALGLSHLTDLIRKPSPRVYRLPSVRIAQFECSPSYFMVEIKRDVDQEPAAKQYLAFLGAYTLHERLLLRLAALSTGVDEARIPMEIDDSLSTYLLTCCKTTCKIWKMQIRRKPRDQQYHQTSSENQERLEPIRYDLQLLDEIDIARSRDRRQLADWINLIHYYGSTKHLAALQNDVRTAMLKLGKTGKTDWMEGIAFVYSNDEGTEIRAVQQSDLLKAYRQGDLEPEGDVSDEVVDFEDGMEVAHDSGMRSRLRRSKKKKRTQDGSSTSTLLTSASDTRGLSIEKMSSGPSEEGKDAVSLAIRKLPSPPDSATSTSPDTRRRNRSPQKRHLVT